MPPLATPPLLLGFERARYVELTPSPPLGVHRGDVQDWTGRSMGEMLLLDWTGRSMGEMLLLYTDGATDVHSEGSDRGMRRLAHAALDGPPDPGSVCGRVIERLEAERFDDIALMAISRVGV